MPLNRQTQYVCFDIEILHYYTEFDIPAYIGIHNQTSQGKLSEQQAHRKHLLLKQDLARLWKILFFHLPLMFLSFKMEGAK